MKNRFKIMSAALALTFMLLFGAVAFAHTANTNMANPSMASTGMPAPRKDNWKRRHRRHHHKREWRRKMR